MAKKEIYHIKKDKDGWRAKKEGSERASVRGETKEEVVQKTIEIARKSNNCTVKIYKLDGKIQEVRNYPAK